MLTFHSFVREMLHVVIDNNEKIFLLGPRGLLDIDSNFGFKKSFFPKVSFFIKAEGKITLSNFLDRIIRILV